MHKGLGGKITRLNLSPSYWKHLGKGGDMPLPISETKTEGIQLVNGTETFPSRIQNAETFPNWFQLFQRDTETFPDFLKHFS